MQLHLFSTPGDLLLSNIVKSCKPHLMGKSKPVVLYLPAAQVTFQNEYLQITREVFEDLAEVEFLDFTRRYNTIEFEQILDRASVVYISGGNTFLLLHRFYESGLFNPLKDRLRSGLPLVAYSAGTVICGKDILTSGDINCCGGINFSAFGFVPYNFIVHYPSKQKEEKEKLALQINQYHSFFNIPILALEDDAYIKVDYSGLRLVRGKCCLIEKNKSVIQLSPGFIG